MATICSLSDLTIEEKVGQMLVTKFREDEVNELIDETHIGGVIYYEYINDLSSPATIRNLSTSLQEKSKLPLFVMIDHEGGRVQHLKKGFTKLPTAKELSDSTLQEIEDIFFTAGKELQEAGINFNLAPVVDIATSPRSFGTDPETVTNCARAAINGLHKAGILTCIKHFPGHGRSNVDSHHALPVLDDLDNSDLAPFRNLKEETDAIMTGHLLVPSLDEHCCATLSPTLLGLIRNDFDKLIITDSLIMRGVLDNVSTPIQAAIRAIKAGADLLLYGGESLVPQDERTTSAYVKEIHKGLIEAIDDGTLTIERIDQSVRRILRAKETI